MIMRLADMRRARGFTLLELLLSIGLLAMLMSGIYTMFDTWLQRAVNRTTAAEILRVQMAAHDFLYANFDAYAGDAPGVFTEIPLSDLTAGNFLPSAYVARNSFKQTIRVFKRNIQTPRLDSAGAPTGDMITSIEVLAVSDDPATGVIRIPNQRLMDAAQAGGPKMGILSEIVLPGSTFTGRITSVYKDWYINYAPGTLPGYGAQPDALGGYLAAYDIVNGESAEANDNYLYRVSIDGRPELNRMDTDLFMNGNTIADTGTMVADKVVVNGNAAFLGKAQGAAADTSQAMTVDQALRIDGNGETRLNMDTSSPECALTGLDADNNRNLTMDPTFEDAGGKCVLRGGELQVTAQNRVDPADGVTVISTAGDAVIDIPGTLRADGSVITDIGSIGLTSNGTTDAYGNSTFQRVVGDSMTASGQVITPTTNVTGGIVQVDQMQTSTMNLYDAATGLDVDGPMITASLRPGLGYNVTAGDLEIGNSATFTNSVTANAIETSNQLTFAEIEDVASAPVTYHDAIKNRDVQCTFESNSKTYCEPVGTTNWAILWSAPSTYRYFVQDCTINANGYTCKNWEANSAFVPTQCRGRCFYQRDGNASGPAKHNEPVCDLTPTACN